MTCATIYKNQSYSGHLSAPRPRPLSSFLKNNFNKMKIYAAKRNKRGLFGEISFGMGRRTIECPHRQGRAARRGVAVRYACGSCWLTATLLGHRSTGALHPYIPTSLHRPSPTLATLFYVIIYRF